MANNKYIEDLKKEQALANKGFWRSAAFTAAAVSIFTASAIALDIGITTLEASALQIVAAVGAVTSIGGAAVTQVASRKVDKIEEELESARQADIERTTKKEIAPSRDLQSTKIGKHRRQSKETASPSVSGGKHAEAVDREEQIPGRGAPYGRR
jgi:hypothetical protein